MIRSELVFESGILKFCSISGHAGAGSKGNDIVCAAVTILARTALKVLLEIQDVKIEGANPERGEFWMRINSYNAEMVGFLTGVGTFLEEGLTSISREYPDFCIVNVEENNGS